MELLDPWNLTQFIVPFHPTNGNTFTHLSIKVACLMPELLAGLTFKLLTVEATSVSAPQWRNMRKRSERKVRHIYPINWNIKLHIYVINLSVKSIFMLWIGPFKGKSPLGSRCTRQIVGNKNNLSSYSGASPVFSATGNVTSYLYNVYIYHL